MDFVHLAESHVEMVYVQLQPCSWSGSPGPFGGACEPRGSKRWQASSQHFCLMAQPSSSGLTSTSCKMFVVAPTVLVLFFISILKRYSQTSSVHHKHHLLFEAWPKYFRQFFLFLSTVCIDYHSVCRVFTPPRVVFCGYALPFPGKLHSCFGFPGVSVVKNAPADAGDGGWIPELRRSPG